MTRILLLSAITLAASACSTTAPVTVPDKPPASVAGINSPEPAPAKPNLGEASVKSVAPDGDEIISVAEIPTVKTTPVAAPRMRRVCRRVQPTGSHTTRRVCYSEAEIDASTNAARQVYGELHRQQQLPIN